MKKIHRAIYIKKRAKEIIMADVFELELHDLHEEDPNRAADSDDDIIEIDEVCRNSKI